jgi:cation transport ATPase
MKLKKRFLYPASLSLGRMAQAGVLVKDARAIEEMNKVETD